MKHPVKHSQSKKKGSQSNSNFNSLKGALIYKYIDSFAYLMDQQSIDLAERQHEHYQEEQVKARHYVVPDNKNKLKACQKCRLLKTEDQWKKSNKCENCRDFKEEQGHNKYTTPKFESMVAILNPNRSWLRRKLFLGKNTVSGAYAVHLT